MRTETKALLVALAALVGCGDPLVFAEVEEPRACLSQASQTFPGIPAGTVTLPLSQPIDLPPISYTDQLDLGKTVLAMPSGASGTMKALDFSLEASQGVDLTGFTTATVSVLPPTGATTPAEAIILSLGAAGHPTANKLILSGSDTDILPYVLTGKLHYRLDASGSTDNPPIGDWTADMTFCLYMKIKVDLTQLGK